MVELSLPTGNGNLCVPGQMRFVLPYPPGGLVDDPDLQDHIEHSSEGGQTFRNTLGTAFPPRASPSSASVSYPRLRQLQARVRRVRNLQWKSSTCERPFATTYRHALQALISYCLASQAGYVAQHVYPSDSRDGLYTSEESILLCCGAAYGPASDLILANTFANTELHHPARLIGHANAHASRYC